MSILKIKNVKKRFKENEVIKGVNIEVQKNEIYGFIGSNGSGKTTTMKMILGLLKIDAGTITVCGEKVTFGNTKTNRHIGFLEDVPQFYNYMTAGEYMNLCMDISNVQLENKEERILNLLNRVGLRDVTTKIKGYSRGMRQRLGIAVALIHKPKLLICDEPTSALDPKGRRDILNILEEIKKDTTIIFSTHILTDVERISDRVGVLYNGMIEREWDLNKIEYKRLGVLLRINETEYQVLKEDIDIKPYSNQTYVVYKETLERIYEILNVKKIYPREIRELRETLEDMYLRITS